jgi:hypothetical protein
MVNIEELQQKRYRIKFKSKKLVLFGIVKSWGNMHCTFSNTELQKNKYKIEN